MNQSQFNSVIDYMGFPGTHTRAKSPQTVTNISKLTINSIVRAEEALVNAYGVDACRIHIKAGSLPVPPEKFDYFTIDNMRHTILGVLPKLELGTGTIMGYACYCKGNG